MTSAPRMRGEAGTTLVELLVTIAILGIAFVTLLGGTFTMVTASDRHRKAATAETILASFAEAVKAAPYVEDTDPACPTAASAYRSTYSPPAHFKTEASDCKRLAGTTAAQKVQLMKLKVESDDGRATESVQVVKRG